jgi:hypothetical protein
MWISPIENGHLIIECGCLYIDDDCLIIEYGYLIIECGCLHIEDGSLTIECCFNIILLLTYITRKLILSLTLVAKTIEFA